MNWIAALAVRLLTAADDLAEARQLENAMVRSGVAGGEAYLEYCRMVGEAADPAAAIATLDAQAADDGVTALGVLIVHCFAAVRADYPAQPDAVAAREAIGNRAAASYPLIGESFGSDALDFAIRLVGQTVIELSRIAASRAPLVRVVTGISLPSARLAYDLYGDPSRAAELVDRNQTGTPLVMPTILTAVAR
jgi:hypothetical protein